MQKLTLYTNPHPRGGMVGGRVEEGGAHYAPGAVAFGPDIKAPAYRAINPMGKVPALAHGDTVLTESLAIITWLAERYPEKALIPAAGSDARGEYYRWLCFALHLEYAAIDRKRAIENSEEQRTAIGYGDFDTAFAVLKARLQDRAHIIGEQFTALDLYYSGLLQWFIQRAQVLPADSVYLDYMNRHLARPAHQRAIALDEALLAEMG